MRLYDGTLVLCVLILVGCFLVGVGSSKALHMPEDNPVEEIAEDVIEQQTGVDVDLSPGSAESDQEAPGLFKKTAVVDLGEYYQFLA